MKFLDQITSITDLPHEPVIIQGPDDLYANWSAVEARYADSVNQKDEQETTYTRVSRKMDKVASKEQKDSPEDLITSLHLGSHDVKNSPFSTPPSSPIASDPPSTKTSPEVRCAVVSKHDATPVPPNLKPLINFVVWYSYENEASRRQDMVFLTNSADAAQIAKDFGVVPKTIHQLRVNIPSQNLQEAKVENRRNKKKSSNRTSSFKDGSEPKTLFSYDEVSSDEEELVFQPRPREPSRPMSSGREANTSFARGRSAAHSPSNSVTIVDTQKPQVPIEEIDPDSFDRGTFARGSIPLANVGNHYGPSPNAYTGRGQRGFGPGPRGGYRGNSYRGRGRGRLFVP